MKTAYEPGAGDDHRSLLKGVAFAFLIIFVTTLVAGVYLLRKADSIDRVLRGDDGAEAQEEEGAKPVDLSGIILPDDPAWGPVSAPVTIVEFSDYECPFCGRFYRQTLLELERRYAEKVRFVFKDFPLEIHPHAQKAHEAAHCAGEQGRYRAYHDLLFSNQRRLGDEHLLEYARRLALDEVKFGACVHSGKYEAKVATGVRVGNSLDVDGTPTFFVNGVRVVGAQPPEAFAKIIDQQLAGH